MQFSAYDQSRADSMMSVMTDSQQHARTIQVNRTNMKRRKCLCFSSSSQAYSNNKIITSKYNFLTFLPLNLMVQFSKFANLYFLILTIMECFPTISDSNGVPVLALPLCFVVGVSMIKDIYEDYLRHQSDKEENNRKTIVGQTMEHLMFTSAFTAAELFSKLTWKSICVG